MRRARADHSRSRGAERRRRGSDPRRDVAGAEHLARALTVHLHLVNLADERHRARLLQGIGAEADADARMQRFMADLLPKLPRFIPE